VPLLEEEEPVVLDRLCRGWSIYQFQWGYRFNGDDILLAHTAARAAPEARRLLDLGSGIGSVGLLWLAQQPRGARVTLLEAQERSAELCRRTLERNGLLLGEGDADGRRAEVLNGDLRDASVLARAGGGFEVVTSNPPYLQVADKKMPLHHQKRYCNYELRGGAEEFARAAAEQLQPEGVFCMVHRHHRESDVLAAAVAAGFVVRQRITAIARGAPKWVVAVCCKHGSMRAEAPLVGEANTEVVIRDLAGNWTGEWDDICRDLGVFQKQGG